MKSNKLTSHHLMYSHIFYVAEEKDIACRLFYDKTGQLENDQVQGATTILYRSKTSQIKSFTNRVHFYPMLIVATVTSRTNDVRSSDAEQRQ